MQRVRGKVIAGALPMDVGAWLRSLGLEQYEATFRDNAIDDTVLPSLTLEDLKDLGIGIVGHRRKLLDAIAALRADAKWTATDGAATIDEPPRDAGQRRQVTVMFVDLVGWTALSARSDPEDLREIISEYHKCINEIALRFGGFVARYFGDGVLLYFGFPRAHEDDAERAVRAGLEIVVAVGGGIQPRAPLQTRIGIATGLVVVDLIGSGEAQEHGMLGDTPNLAARLQEIAEPNMVVIAEGTRRLLGDLFELQDLGAKSLKGMARPVRAWAALRIGSAESRFEAMHTTGLTALIGREEEFDLLLRRWATAKTGEGQVVLLSGEAGIGKSRLTASLLERLAGEPHTRLRYFCSPQHTDSAFYPIIRQIEHAAGLARNDTPQAKHDKLATLLAQTSTSRQDATLIAEMLSLPSDGRYPVIELTPQLRRERTLVALISQMKALAQSSPVLMVFEDAHWADPTSLEQFGRAVGEIPRHRVLLILTFRPEFEPTWIGQPHVTVLTLNRLPPGEVGAMVDDIVGNKPLLDSIRQDIVERTDGIPLFIEEMTKAVLEAESEGAARRTAASVPSSAMAVPPSLHASLIARLDRLGPARELAQIGAAIGREFTHALLAAVARKPEAELRSTLDLLIQAGLLFRQGIPPHATYLFKHALVQDAAYDLLLREQRRALHARIVETFEHQFSEIAENQPQLVARHCTEAGQIEKAAELWGKAGQRSLQRSALVEATEQLRRALDQIATLPATPALRREEIKLQVALISPLLPLKGYAAPETKAAVERARLLIERAEALGEPPEDPLLLFSVLYGFWVANYVAFNGDVMRELAAQFLALAGRQKATAPLMIGHRIMGLSSLVTGDIADGRAQLDQAIALYSPFEHRSLATRFGQDVLVASLSLRSWALCVLGLSHAALADTERALKDAREIGQAATLMYALLVASITNVICGNYAAANALVDELTALTNQTGSLFWGAWAILQRGGVLALTGKASDAVQAITSGLAAWRSTGSTAMTPSYLSYLARAHAELGQFSDAARCIGQAMTAIETTSERWHEAEVNRTAGEIALLSPEPDAAKAEVYFERALEVARGQQAKLWELRAAVNMARLWRDQGKRERARDLLGAVCGWFTEDFDAPGLKEAKALLGTLR
jgi:class 3 adenylate cyclase/predicted ATPase